ncbi:DUF4259 domain-containing protein [Duganella qianjiadongensis]|uniref:DUF4259 domain-containing protein n=1 Tax=Duganella qianjiadongensis TaxID=2692176 RepID=A0ABW9VI66_9BURK|nr:DUF4259 domain-containing protein [Duganella qianjiadongensis]MYM39191.1 DUF4259 domain-containing protein [Duganella qianjiadongensis]
MGTWAVDAFGNDYAQDWAEDLAQVSNLEAVESTLDVVLQAGSGELAAPFAAEALVAVEVLARLQGKGGPQTDDSRAVDEWVAARKAKARVRTDLAQKALQVLDKVLAPGSELRELWEDSEHYAEWSASVADLRGRLQA